MMDDGKEEEMCNVGYNQAGNGGGKEGAKIDGYQDCSTVLYTVSGAANDVTCLPFCCWTHHNAHCIRHDVRNAMQCDSQGGKI